jgi:hypothetical protein
MAPAGERRRVGAEAEVSEFFDRMEDRLNEITAASEQMARAMSRCADAVEMLVELAVDDDLADKKERLRWPGLVVLRDDDPPEPAP